MKKPVNEVNDSSYYWLGIEKGHLNYGIIPIRIFGLYSSVLSALQPEIFHEPFIDRCDHIHENESLTVGIWSGSVLNRGLLLLRVAIILKESDACKSSSMNISGEEYIHTS